MYEAIKSLSEVNLESINESLETVELNFLKNTINSETFLNDNNNDVLLLQKLQDALKSPFEEQSKNLLKTFSKQKELDVKAKKRIH